MKSKRVIILFYLIIVSLFAFTLGKLDLNILLYLRKFPLPTVLLLVGLKIATIVVISHQWFSLVKVFNPKVRFLKIIELNIIGTFTESITPAVKSGGEGVKLLLLNRNFSLQYNEGLSVVIVQKTISSLVFVLYFFLAITHTRFTFHLNLLHCLLALGVGLILLICISAFIPKKIKFKSMHFLSKVSKNLSSFKDRKVLLGYLTFNNFLVWLGYPLKLLIITKVFNVDLSFLQIAGVIFITYGVSMLPTTPGSVGTYEGTMTLLLRLVGVPTEKALAISIITRFFTFWIVVIGSGLYLGLSKLVSTTNLISANK